MIIISEWEIVEFLKKEYPKMFTKQEINRAVERTLNDTIKSSMFISKIYKNRRTYFQYRPKGINGENELKKAFGNQIVGLNTKNY